MGRHLACMVEMRNAYKILVRKCEGKRPCRRPRHRWEDNVRKDLGGKVWTGYIWLRMGTSGRLL
jgi:hypothetical protein